MGEFYDVLMHSKNGRKKVGVTELVSTFFPHMAPYYMDNGVLLETKTLVELIRHYVRDQTRVFSVFHPCE